MDAPNSVKLSLPHDFHVVKRMRRTANGVASSTAISG